MAYKSSRQVRKNCNELSSIVAVLFMLYFPCWALSLMHRTSRNSNIEAPALPILKPTVFIDCNYDGSVKRHKGVPNESIFSTYSNVSFGKLTVQIILTFLSCILVPPLADTPPQGRHEPLHHHVSGAGGMSARQRLLLHFPPTQLQKDGVLQLPRHQLLQVMWGCEGCWCGTFPWGGSTVYDYRTKHFIISPGVKANSIHIIFNFYHNTVRIRDVDHSHSCGRVLGSWIRKEIWGGRFFFFMLEKKNSENRF